MYLCAGLLAFGSTGLVLLALGDPVAMGIGVIIALMGTWGFNGVYVYSLMRAYADAPGAATGATMPGGLIGGVAGPIVFGLLAERIGYPVAWIFAFAAAIASVAGFLVAAARLREPLATDG